MGDDPDYVGYMSRVYRNVARQERAAIREWMRRGFPPERVILQREWQEDEGLRLVSHTYAHGNYCLPGRKGCPECGETFYIHKKFGKRVYQVCCTGCPDQHLETRAVGEVLDFVHV